MLGVMRKRAGGMVGKQTSSRILVGNGDEDVTAIEILFVEAGDGVLSLGGGGECDETEAARVTGFTIAHHARLRARKRRSGYIPVRDG